jgi:alpha-D-xyloside xylohydrolase
MIGDRLLAAPVTAGEHARSVYLPAGGWYDFWTGEPFAGEQYLSVDVPLAHIPLFVRGGAVLPLARATLHTADPDSLELEARVYGDGSSSCLLFEDDGLTLASEDGEFNRLELAWDPSQLRGSLRREGAYNDRIYHVVEWKVMGAK